MVNNLLSAIIKDVAEKRKIIYLLAQEEKSVNENKLCAALSREGDCPWELFWEIYEFLKTFLHLP